MLWLICGCDNYSSMDKKCGKSCQEEKHDRDDEDKVAAALELTQAGSSCAAD